MAVSFIWHMDYLCPHIQSFGPELWFK